MGPVSYQVRLMDGKVARRHQNQIKIFKGRGDVVTQCFWCYVWLCNHSCDYSVHVLCEYMYLCFLQSLSNSSSTEKKPWFTV